MNTSTEAVLKTLLITGLLALVCSTAVHAQTTLKNFSKLNAKGYKEIYVSNGTLNHRVGNAVWVTVLSNSHAEYKNASAVLVGCDGTWVGDPFITGFSFNGDLFDAYRDLEEKLMKLPYDVISLNTGSLVGEEIAASLKAKAKGLCTAAKKGAIKNQLLGVSEVENLDGSGKVASLTLGSVKREANGVLKAWIKRSPYVKKNATMSDGSEALMNGKPFLIKDFSNQGSKVEQWVYDCKDRTINLLRTVDYRADGTIESDDTFKNDSPMMDVLPDSIGEAEMEWVCRLYGKG